ncbi:redox-sensing transcriptional repressor Rex [Leuconostoc pseudomesenteroides]|uniref:Redox-sensing transcriptional repressor Rex n=1 Tax=Leuconostoc pseudomesenteroides TaxID=33968 RepID=A0A1X0VDB6_LEUPS|nr:redox-sensing transcriptional repressor Rex [Leuconostoc pseudomesenteroides]OQJ71761.1 redox-sensing transcriptional repressor Rex [Leuconostoc pseudomesenteroides]OQJ77102.1 redox-sensing transcriptional repressor Rex [Leuconostoc pseudomesenteroides]OQJ78081.1 redox-sensing transcriptional repressor Rex [Leuconostoc pseudomesenteroides]ORI37153.1 redox-sensing transcriptional repressor Rex [Leuconostoc pseudomesenteroides]ORI45798.1 redox-sensing transcriptional repressor Rex [Leuconosto
MTQQPKIPRATAKRLPIYFRYLTFLHDSGTDRISSSELSDAIKFDAATIRRDFSYFGALGKRGYGYEVKALLDFFANVLDQDSLINVALIGAGNLGQALLNFNFHQSSNMRISAAFDADEKRTGTILAGVPIYKMSELKEQISAQRINIAILTVPQGVAQDITDQLVSAGVKGILNFTPLRVTVPANVRVQNVDLTNELQTLVYFIENYGSITTGL